MKAITLSGFLGAGKTSFLLKLCQYLVQRGQRVAIIENEVGAVSVDGAILAGEGVSMRELFNGCICCSLANELDYTIRTLQEEQDPDWMIMEATGLAIPEITSVRFASGRVRRYSLQIVVLVDAARFPQLAKVSPLVTRQVENADVLYLNKVDLVDAQAKADVIAQIRELNTHAPLVEIVATEEIEDSAWEPIL